MLEEMTIGSKENYNPLEAANSQYFNKVDDYVPAHNNEAKEVNTAYLRTVRSQDFLTKEAEIELIALAQGPDQKAADRARDKIVRAHLRLAMKVASTFYHKHKNSVIDKEDLIQEASKAITVAIDKFKPDNGARFATCAIFWIRAELQDFVHANKFSIKLSTSSDSKKIVRNYQYMKRIITEEFPDINEEELLLKIAEKLQVSIVVLHAMKQYVEMPVLSLDARVGNQEDYSSFGSTLPDSHTPNPEEAAELSIDSSKLSETIQTILDKLEPREARIIKERHMRPDGDQTILEDLAQEFGVSRERIRQIEVKALERVRRLFLNDKISKKFRNSFKQ